MWLLGMPAETVTIITMQCSCEVQRMLSVLHISVCPSTSVTQFCYLLIVERCCLFLVVAAACQSRRSIDARRRRRVHGKVLDVRLQDTHDVRRRRQTHQLPCTDTHMCPGVLHCNTHFAFKIKKIVLLCENYYIKKTHQTLHRMCNSQWRQFSKFISRLWYSHICAEKGR